MQALIWEERRLSTRWRIITGILTRRTSCRKVINIVEKQFYEGSYDWSNIVLDIGIYTHYPNRTFLVAIYQEWTGVWDREFLRSLLYKCNTMRHVHVFIIIFYKNLLQVKLHQTCKDQTNDDNYVREMNIHPTNVYSLISIIM